MSFHKEFEKFHGIIRIDKDKRTSLLSNKSALRDKIKKHFKEKGREEPKFYIQGSMDKKVSTGINPINGDYDIDDGIYLQGVTTDNITPATAHKWVLDAVDGHTKSKEDKSKCVRVNYAKKNRDEEGFEKHVDLPIYIEENDTQYLAIKGKGWIENKPKEISDWFKDEREEKGTDFRKAIRFLKAWKDKRESENKALQLFGGFQLSILVSEYFPDSYDNDLEKLFYKVVKNINDNLWIHPPLDNPINTDQDTLEYYSDSRIATFKEKFQTLFEKVEDAYEEENVDKKVIKWRRVFGDRFPDHIEDKDEKEKSLETPAVIVGATDISQAESQFA